MKETIFKPMINKEMTSGMASVYYTRTQTTPMDTVILNEKLKACLEERQALANELQNEVNQLLTAAQLWIEVAKKENNLPEDNALQFAETHLKNAIDHLRSLHYSMITPKR